jgi:hypothetical protein
MIKRGWMNDETDFVSLQRRDVDVNLLLLDKVMNEGRF